MKRQYISEKEKVTCCVGFAPGLSTLQVKSASTLNLIWTQHNKVQYEDASPLPLPQWFELSFLGWMTSVRLWLRLQDHGSPIRISALYVLHTLRGQANYRRLWEQHPNSLLLAPTAATN
ncbi:hypothetical protein DYB26_016136 [Aphanomyces astaci]|uniref:Uncharacterized protein n=1 Tax=Aphanomyces astaci TaxID=112090 RepID=A0A3R6WAR8_APHAT|nr:hypothetical protein DYB26_016136 [Aphanomyces astaci]